MVTDSHVLGEAGDGRKPELWLAVEASTDVGSVAVQRNGLVLETTLRIKGAHSERILPAIHDALRTAGASPAEVSNFIVGSGPGSFTGVRIAASMAKGWGAARRIPIYAYSSLMGVAAGSGVQGLVCPMFDARRGEVYGACYELSADGAAEIMAPGAWQVEHLLEELLARGIEPVFSGEGALLHREVIRRKFQEASILPEHLGLPRAASLIWLRQVAPGLGRVERLEAWGPLYVRDWKVPEEQGRR